jgi:hypothetical protein
MLQPLLGTSKEDETPQPQGHLAVFNKPLKMQRSMHRQPLIPLIKTTDINLWQRLP